jgi:hypothetical protein
MFLDCHTVYFFLFVPRYAKQVQQDVEDIIVPPIKVILVDSNLAKVYANTNKSNVDFP